MIADPSGELYWPYDLFGLERRLTLVSQLYRASRAVSADLFLEQSEIPGGQADSRVD